MGPLYPCPCSPPLGNKNMDSHPPLVIYIPPPLATLGKDNGVIQPWGQRGPPLPFPPLVATTSGRDGGICLRWHPQLLGIDKAGLMIISHHQSLHQSASSRFCTLHDKSWKAATGQTVAWRDAVSKLRVRG